MTDTYIKKLIRTEIQSILMDIIQGMNKRIEAETKTDVCETMTMIDNLKRATGAIDSCKGLRINHALNNSMQQLENKI